MTEKVRVANSAYYKMIFGKIFSGLGVLVIGLIVMYLAFALTIMRFIPSSNMGPVLVKNATFEGGLIPAGAVVAIGDDERPEGALGNIYNAFIPQDVKIVKVVAGPNGEIEWKGGGLVTVNGRLLDVELEEKPEGSFLSGRYIVKCLEGCEPGAFLVTDNQVLGVPLIDKYRVKVNHHESLEQSNDFLKQSGEE